MEGRKKRGEERKERKRKEGRNHLKIKQNLIQGFRYKSDRRA